MFSKLSDFFLIMSRKYKNDPDKFYFICGDVTFKTQRRNLTPLVTKLYESILALPSDNKKKRGFHTSVVLYVRVFLLDGWEDLNLCLFAIPVIWTEPSNHSSDVITVILIQKVL